jgi:predicted ABC-class ATPase
MRDKKEFYNMLMDIADKPVSEYGRLAGDFDFSRYVLKVSQVPVDNLAQPALFIVRVPQSIAGFPPHYYSTPVRRTALEDFLTRRVADQIELLSRYDEQGISRRHLQMPAPGQKILPRTSLMLTEEYVEARIYVLLPQRDGRIDGERVKEIFFDELATVVSSSLIYCNLPETEVGQFVEVMEDADQIRQLLPTRGLISFIAEGSCLARLGNSDYPDYEQMTPLVVADNAAIEVEVPNAGAMRGLGVPAGVTLILGDEYSGRVALSRALAAGIYNHIPGDGRERVITVPDAVHIAAEPGRPIQKVDISAFMTQLPAHSRVDEFSTAEASAGISQAAALVEALEIGARALLFDESDSAPAFLSRDARLTQLMSESAAQLAPLSARARQLVDDLGISIIVAGSASVAEFVPVADTVLLIQNHRVSDITQSAKRMDMTQLQILNEDTNLAALVEKNRWIVPTSIDSSAGPNDQVIHAEAADLLKFGRSLINLQGLTQLADKHQMATIGLILYYAKLRYMDEGRPIREIMDLIDRDLGTEGLECLSRDLRGDLARPRRYEIAAALNRLDSMRVSHVE